ANLELARWKPKTEQQFDFYNAQIYTHARYLPASKINKCDLDNSLVADGSEIISAVLHNSIIGVRSIIGQNVTIENSYVMGADYYEDLPGLEYNKAHGVINIGIGDGCVIRNAIIDKNARIGEHCVLTNEKNLDNCDGDSWYIRDGIIIVPKNAVIKPGTKV
ncbi:MAG: glucose-1-phosphate adenylyltransferase, partial [Spirochaetales bacterium]|nr:glucose-1-phosphate adenylyltransferase [Spirochaetales bacterium]